MLMYKFIFILSILLTCFAGQGKAADFVEAGISYSLQSDSTVSVAASDDGYSGFVTVPATVTHDGLTYSVTGVDDRAFQSCASLTGVALPEGLTSVGSYAFNQCSALDSVSLPSTLQ